MNPRPESARRLAMGFCLAALLGGGIAADEGPTAITLPAPRLGTGVPLMDALARRHTAREFRPDPLPLEVLGDLLWAAGGVNRPASGMRTAPSAVNWQEIDIHVAMADGLYLYDAVRHRLRRLLPVDVRPQIGIQPFVAAAPVVLIYVADLARMRRASDEDKAFYSACDTGFISQNVYLFSASEGLNTCVVGLVRRRALGEAMGLREDQRIILCQPVGRPPAPQDPEPPELQDPAP